MVRALCGKGKTGYFSTHIMEVAERLCDRAGIVLAALLFRRLLAFADRQYGGGRELEG